MPATVGLMLYTIRDLCEHDLPGALAVVKRAGFDHVELASRHGRSPLEWSKLLADHDLRPVGAHVGLGDLEQKLEDVLDFAETLSIERVTVPWTPARTREETDELAKRLETVARVVAGAGVKLLYHNHDFELKPFADEGPGPRTMLDRLARVDGLRLEIDTAWVWFAGADVAGVLETHADKVELLHIKDFAHDEPPPHFKPVGEGRVPLEAALRTAAVKNAAALIVEQDELHGQDPLENLTASRTNLQKMLEEI